MENKKKKITPTNNKAKIKIFNFNESYVPPTYKYDTKLGIVTWGDDNLYPQYLLSLYNNNGSVMHKSIVNKKIRLISGKAFKEVKNQQLIDFIDNNDLAEHVKRATTDYELFNTFAFEVIWSNDGKSIASMQHLPAHKIRKGIVTDEIKYEHIWYSNNWKDIKKEENVPVMIPVYNPAKPSGKQVFMFSEYNPETDGVYSIPVYSNGSAMNYIELDYEISVFHLNQVKQGYSPSFILNFATGIPTDEEMDENLKDFNKNYKGTANSGKIIFTYSEGSDGKPELTPIVLNDSDERFIMLQEMTDKSIITAHEIPQALVSLIAGKLGSTTERKELMEEFQQSFITPRQESIESVLNEILSNNNYNEELLLQTYIEESDDSPVVNDAQAEAQATLKGSVAGVQGIIQIQTSVASGLTDRSSAQALLELIYGFNPEDALRLLGDVKEGDNIPPSNDINNTQI